MKRFSLFAILTAFVLGMWMGCTVDDGPLDLVDVWPCTDNADCVSGFICGPNSVCVKSGGGGSDCIDADEDGYGVGEDRSTCFQCEQFARCEEDCNDTDPKINPGAAEPCNGLDDNCNDEIDEPTSCEDDLDCDPLDPLGEYQATCGTSGVCEVRMTTQICNPPRADCPCNADPLVCTGGTYPNVPDPSECFQ